MTPLIDVVFLILIFFLVSTTFKEEEALSLTLPTANSASKPIERKDINLELTQDRVAMDGKVVNFKELDIQLSKIEDKKRTINIKIDKDVKYERVVELFDNLSKYGLTNLLLVENRDK
jgi:biopolymer transport protein ExbD